MGVLVRFGLLRWKNLMNEIYKVNFDTQTVSVRNLYDEVSRTIFNI